MSTQKQLDKFKLNYIILIVYAAISVSCPWLSACGQYLIALILIGILLVPSVYFVVILAKLDKEINFNIEKKHVFFDVFLIIVSAYTLLFYIGITCALKLYGSLIMIGFPVVIQIPLTLTILIIASKILSKFFKKNKNNTEDTKLIFAKDEKFSFSDSVVTFLFIPLGVSFFGVLLGWGRTFDVPQLASPAIFVALMIIVFSIYFIYRGIEKIVHKNYEITKTNLFNVISILTTAIVSIFSSILVFSLNVQSYNFVEGLPVWIIVFISMIFELLVFILHLIFLLKILKKRKMLILSSNKEFLNSLK